MLTELDKINAIEVPPDLLFEMIHRNGLMLRAGRRSQADHVNEIVGMLTGRGYTGRLRAELAIAVLFRFEAMAGLILSGKAHGWVEMNAEGLGPVHPALICAAAEEPMIKGDPSSVEFDAEKIQARVLTFAGARGKA